MDGCKYLKASARATGFKDAQWRDMRAIVKAVAAIRGYSMINNDIKELREALEAGPTPGPWHDFALLSGSENHRGYGISSAQKWRLASVAPVDTDGKEGGANAKLIAAASPDRIARLLDALKAEQDEVHRLQASHSALYGEVERLRADAERWRYWRNFWPALCRMEVARFARLDLRETYVQSPADMDKVTDAARGFQLW
jgi:hypothetical protein